MGKGQHSAMTTTIRLAVFLTLGLGVSVGRAEDWVGIDGKTYSTVKVISHDDGFVTVLDSDGGAKIPLRTLSPQIRARFGYDPKKAAVAEAAAAAEQQGTVPGKPVPLFRSANFTPIDEAPPPAVPSSPSTAAGSATASKTPGAHPEINVPANEAKIAEDQEQIENIKVDIRDTKKDLAKEQSRDDYYDQHSDDTGSAHPNNVGNDTGQRIENLQKQEADLEAEIVKLQAEDAAAGAGN
jgi:hypothetical protein